MWSDGGAEKVMCRWADAGGGGGGGGGGGACEVAADLRIKRPRYSAVLQSPVRGSRSPTSADVTLTSRRWSIDDVQVRCISSFVLLQSYIVGSVTVIHFQPFFCRKQCLKWDGVAYRHFGAVIFCKVAAAIPKLWPFHLRRACDVS